MFIIKGKENLENDMNEFLSDFVNEVQKIEEFYLKKIKHYADEFYMLRNSFRKYHNLDHTKNKRSTAINNAKTSTIISTAISNFNKVTPLYPIIESVEDLESARQTL